LIGEYLKRVADGLCKTDAEVLEEMGRHIIGTKKTGARIFTAGNGGSAATASHFCNDLIKGCRVDGRTGFAATCLCDAMPVLTCLANDFCYEDVFDVMLRTHAKAGDKLVVFSGSGNSPNVVKAAQTAKAMGMEVLGLLGRDGGKLKPLCDLYCIAPTLSMEELEDMHMCYCHALVDYMRGILADMWDMEIINFCSGTGFHSALLDFDGTVSLLREGWQQVMIPYFVEELSAADKTASNEDLTGLVTDFVDFLTGKQTIFQCMRLCEEIEKRGVKAKDPYEYKAEYLRRLHSRIKNRLQALKDKTAQPSEYLAPGALEFLAALKDKGVKLYLASGTDEVNVLEEARLLGADKFFDGGIFGAKDDMKGDVKESVIRGIIEKKGLGGEGLLVIGDGYVEIQLAKEFGGYAIAAATDEVRKKGVNAWKRKRLLAAGADMVIPDFVETERLMSFLFGQKK